MSWYCGLLRGFVLLGTVSLAGVAIGAEATTRPAPVLPPGQSQRDLRSYLLRHAPHFVPPSDAREWAARSEQLRQRVLDEVVFRGVPADWRTGERAILWGDTLEGDGYAIRKLRFEIVPGTWAGGLLYEPDGVTGKVPAILNPNGHVGEPGMAIDYKQIRCINLAKRGMLALNLEWIGMGQLRDGFSHNDLSYLDLCGVSGLSLFYLELERGLDILLAHPSADLERVAVTGLSGGGWQTILISALDTRVRLAAPNAGYIGIERRIWNSRDTGDREQNATDLVSVADYVDLTALLAPRPALLIYNVKDDCCFRAERARYSVYEPIVPVYELFGAAERFAMHVNHDPGTHNYLLDNRQALYAFLNRQFVPAGERIDEEIPVESEVREQAELAIDYPADNASFRTLAMEMMGLLPRRPVPKDDSLATNIWHRETRAKLREIVRPDRMPAIDPEDVVALSAAADAVAGVTGTAHRVRIGQTWTLPMVVYEPADGGGRVSCLIVADGGLADAHDAIREVLARKGRAIVVDLLGLGECSAGEKGNWKQAQMISTLGQRSLGIQVAQLDALVRYVRGQQPARPVEVVAQGRVAGLAALMTAALEPERVDRLELRGMDASLKHLIRDRVTYSQVPSMYCFGLLELADVPELIALAEPTKVELIPPG